MDPFCKKKKKKESATGLGRERRETIDKWNQSGGSPDIQNGGRGMRVCGGVGGWGGGGGASDTSGVLSGLRDGNSFKLTHTLTPDLFRLTY